MTTRDNSTGVVITGIGLVTPLALSLTEWVERCQLGEVLRPEEVEGEEIPFHRFDPKEIFGRGYKYWLPATQYALVATEQAIQDAGLTPELYGPEVAGVAMGTNHSVYQVNEGFAHTINTTGANDLSPMQAPNCSVNIPASTLSIRYGYRAFNVTFTTACVAGVQAIDVACQALRRGRAEMVLAGAVEGQPPQLSDNRLSAPAVAGGACVFVLETARRAEARGAKIYGEIGEVRSCFLPPGPGSLEMAEEVVAAVLRDLPAHSHVVAPTPVHLTRCSTVELNPLHDLISGLCTVDNGFAPIDSSLGAIEGFTLSPMLALANAIARGGHGIITTLGPEGHFMALRTDRRLQV